MNTIIEQRRKFHKAVCVLALVAAVLFAVLLIHSFALIPVLLLIVVLWRAGSEAYLHHEICPPATIVFFSSEEEKEKCIEWAKAHPHDYGYLFYASLRGDEKVGESNVIETAIDLIRLYRIPQALFCEGNTHEEEILAICQKYGVTVRYPRKKSFCFSYG